MGVTRSTRPRVTKPFAAQGVDSVTDDPATLSDAVRYLFGIEDGQKVVVDNDVDEDSQESSFMNATLQDASDTVAFSVATTVEVPHDVASLGEQEITGYLSEILSTASTRVPVVQFHIQVGPKRRD